MLLPAVRGLDARGELPEPVLSSCTSAEPALCSVPRSRRPHAAPAPAARCPIPTLRFANTARAFRLTGAAACLFLQGMGGNFIMALVAWLCGVGWCFTMCCWVPDPYGKQPRVAVTDMER